MTERKKRDKKGISRYESAAVFFRTAALLRSTIFGYSFPYRTRHDRNLCISSRNDTDGLIRLYFFASFFKERCQCKAIFVGKRCRSPPFKILKLLIFDFRILEGNMREDEFFLYINGQRVRVSEEIYKEYRHSEDKEQYFMEYLKQGRYVKNQDSGRTEYIPSREVSYEKLLEESHELRHQEEALEEKVLRKLLMEDLARALRSLSDEELELIREIFWLEKTERELSNG